MKQAAMEPVTRSWIPRSCLIERGATSFAGDLGNVIEATSIRGRRSDFFTAEKLAAGNLGLLQQYRHIAAGKICGGLSGTGESGRCIRMVSKLSQVRGTKSFHLQRTNKLGCVC